MKRGFRQSMGWVHTWGGLVVGWILFFVFLTGTAGYFDTEIDHWMQPERPLVVGPVSAGEAVAAAQRRLEDVAPNANRWFIGLPDGRSASVSLFWAGGDDRGREELDPSTGRPIAHRATGGGQVLYRMHYDLHYMSPDWAHWIVGICTMFMLVAIVTGVIVHKRIFADFFTFRPRKGQRSWLDAHNLLSVVALPFHLMITYSGLVFFGYLYMAPVIAATYGASEQARGAFFDDLFGRTELPPAAGVAGRLTPLAPLIAEAEARLGTVRSVNVRNPADANARIVVAGGPPSPSRARAELVFDGVDGSLLRVSDPPTAPMATYQTLLGLHEGLFAGPALRWLYFLSGLTGTAMIGAGLVLWTVKRRRTSGETLGFRLVERLNVGTIAGLPVGIAGYFWANRLIPAGMAERAAWEAHAMFLAWAAMLALAFVRPAPRAWAEALWIATAAFGLLPVVNAVTTERHLGVTLPAGAWDLAGFDLTVLAIGIGFGLAARQAGRVSVAQAPPVPARPARPERVVG